MKGELFSSYKGFKAGESDEQPERVKRAPVVFSSVLLATIFLCIYILFRGFSFFHEGYRLVDRFFAILLFCGQAFIFIHAIGYFLSSYKASKGYEETKKRLVTKYTEPSVAILIATFNESRDILEDTISAISNMDYGNKKIYLLDDSTRKEVQSDGEEVARLYDAVYIHREDRKGYKAGALNDALPEIDAEYIAIFDADQKPVRSFLREVIPLLEEDKSIAFVQTPQYYEKTESTPVAFAAAQQQAVFYEYICEGKNVSDAMFCCGTNVVFNKSALMSIGENVQGRMMYFDETSVTEDFATSVKFHVRGWRSLYYNRVYVYGIGPETLSGYFTQQMRWAMGTLGVYKKIVKLFLRNPFALSSGQWWEYTLSGTYYFVGWATFFLMICPIAFLLFNVKPLIASPVAYLSAFVPYFFLSMNLFYYTMTKRGYRIKDLWLGQSLGFSSFYIYMKAALVAMLGLKRAFGVTPKGVGGKIPLKDLWVQVLMAFLSAIAGIWGILKVIYLKADLVAILINVFWVFYHCLLFSALFFYFNKTVEEKKPERIFRSYPMGGVYNTE